MRLGPSGLSVSKPPSSGGGGGSVISEYWAPPSVTNPNDEEMLVVPPSWSWWDINASAPLAVGAGPINIWAPNGVTPQAQVDAVQRPSWLLFQPASVAPAQLYFGKLYNSLLPNMTFRARLGAWSFPRAAGVSTVAGSIDISLTMLTNTGGIPTFSGNAVGISDYYSGGLQLVPYAAYGNMSARLSVSASSPDVADTGSDMEFIMCKRGQFYYFFVRGANSTAFLGRVDWGAGHPFDIGPAWLGIRFLMTGQIWSSPIALPPVFRADYFRELPTDNFL